MKTPVLTDSLVIAAASALAYLASFLFEWGYADHFGVPASLISPSLTTVLVAAAAVGGVLLWLVIMSPLYSPLFVASESLALKPYRFFLRQLAVMVVFTILVVATFGWVWPILAILAMAVALPLVLSLASALLTEHSLPVRERFAKHADIQDRDIGFALVDRFKQAVGPSGSWMVVVCTIVLFVAYGAGHASATRQIQFPTFKADPSVALLRSYGDLMIGVRVDRAARRATGDLVLTWLADKKTVELNVEAIGPLARALAQSNAVSAGVPSVAVPSASRPASGNN